MELIIIGNGFDLAHSLDTRYSDFMEYLWENDKEFYDMLTKYIYDEDLWNDFEKALGYFDDGELLEMCNAAYLNYANVQDDAKEAISDEIRFSAYISEHLQEWIKNIDTKVLPIVSDKIVNNQNLFLNFNYTDTLERAYGIEDKRICYIHGKALHNDRLIIGHHNYVNKGKEPYFASYEEYSEWLEFQYSKSREEVERENQVEEYFINTYKDTEALIVKNKHFFEGICHVGDIYVLGHSLSSVDYAYFQKVYSNVPKECVWNITCYSDKDRENAEKLILSLGISNYRMISFDDIM